MTKKLISILFVFIFLLSASITASAEGGLLRNTGLWGISRTNYKKQCTDEYEEFSIGKRKALVFRNRAVETYIFDCYYYFGVKQADRSYFGLSDILYILPNNENQYSSEALAKAYQDLVGLVVREYGEPTQAAGQETTWALDGLTAKVCIGPFSSYTGSAADTAAIVFSCSAPASSVYEPASSLPRGAAMNFVYTLSGQTTAVPFGVTAAEVPELVKGKLKKCKMPLWSDPDGKTKEQSGYYFRDKNPKFTVFDLPLDDVRYFFTYLYSEDGADQTRENAQLYLVKFSPKYSVKKSGIDSVIKSLTAEYGSPDLMETYTTALLLYNGTRRNSKTYHRTYTWKCGGNTGIKLTYDAPDYQTGYEDIIFYIGKTDMDATIKAGKTDRTPSAVKTSVKSGSITFTEKTTGKAHTLEKGTIVCITGYDAATNRFIATFTKTTSTARTTRTSIEINTKSEDFEGYVDGNGLSTSRKDLLAHFSAGQ